MPVKQESWLSVAISKEYMAYFRKISADLLGINEEMNAYRLEIYLRGGRIVATFTKDGASPYLVLKDFVQGFDNNKWQFIQTDDGNTSVIFRIDEIEAIKVIDNAES